MDRIADQTTLTEVLRQEVASYAVESYDGDERLYYAENPDDHVYCVLAPYHPQYGKADLVIMARIVNDHIVIDTDKTSKPLYNALRSAGVPKEQIIVPGNRTTKDEP